MIRWISTFALLLCMHLSASAQTQLPPDIVVILADDFSVRDGSPWGASGIPVPNLQMLADKGLVFDQAFVTSPSCAPSRASLLTGLWPARNGAESNHRKPRPEIRKWPAYFQDLGYETAAFGKVSHYGHTAEYGFDTFAHDTFHDHAGIQAAIDFLAARPTGSRRPLCLMIGSNWPHVPWPEPDQPITPETGPLTIAESPDLPLPAGSIDTPQTRLWRKRYAAAVARLDLDLGRILQAVQQHMPNALIVFSADHGAQWPLAKWNLYDAGLQTPLIVAWPGKVQQGRTNALVSWIDLLPTLLDAASAAPQPQLDGRSFLPVLQGTATTHRDAIFGSHLNDNRINVYPMRCIRTARWKYIRNLRPDAAFTTHIDLMAGRLGQRAFFAEWEVAAKTDPAAAALLQRYHQRPAEELYDITTDPQEQHNLIAATGTDNAAAVAALPELRRQLDAWLSATGDQLKLPVKPRLLADPDAWGPAAAISQ
jgi:arylsulfatase A-like enzyme